MKKIVLIIFILLLSGCINKFDKLREDLNLEAERINYCQKDSDCDAICLCSCPGSFMVYNEEENLEPFLGLYSEYIEEKYKNESRPDCFMNFCDNIRDSRIELLCNNNKCKLKDNFLGMGSSCINCK